MPHRTSPVPVVEHASGARTSGSGVSVKSRSATSRGRSRSRPGRASSDACDCRGWLARARHPARPHRMKPADTMTSFSSSSTAPLRGASDRYLKGADGGQGCVHSILSRTRTRAGVSLTGKRTRSSSRCAQACHGKFGSSAVGARVLSPVTTPNPRTTSRSAVKTGGTPSQRRRPVIRWRRRRWKTRGHLKFKRLAREGR